jgi:hypothetical protein
MAKFQSSFFSDESYKYTSDLLESIYKDLRCNPSFVVARCEKDNEGNSPASIKLDTEAVDGIKRNWEITAKSDIAKICEGYLEYKPDAIILYSLDPKSPRVLVEKNYFTGEVATYNY